MTDFFREITVIKWVFLESIFNFFLNTHHNPLRAIDDINAHRINQRFCMDHNEITKHTLPDAKAELFLSTTSIFTLYWWHYIHTVYSELYQKLKSIICRSLGKYHKHDPTNPLGNEWCWIALNRYWRMSLVDVEGWIHSLPCVSEAYWHCHCVNTANDTIQQTPSLLCTLQDIRMPLPNQACPNLAVSFIEYLNRGWAENLLSTDPVIVRAFNDSAYIKMHGGKSIVQAMIIHQLIMSMHKSEEMLVRRG